MSSNWWWGRWDLYPNGYKSAARKADLSVFLAENPGNNSSSGSKSQEES